MTQADNQPYDKPAHFDCLVLLDELMQAVHEDEINEVVWQALICAYLGHPLWRDVAEAVFAKHGYTPEEIRQGNDEYARRLAVSERMLNEPDYGPHPVLDELTRMAQEDGLYDPPEITGM